MVAVVAVPLILHWGRRSWFVIDDWDFLTTRTGGNLGDLFRPHAGHWTTLPVIAYRLMWWLIGIRSYAAYQLMLIVLHLMTAALLRVVMRRAGVGPWLATLVATVFVFLGSGSANVVIAFQITFAGSLVFGLVHLLLAMHEGPVDARDGLGLLAGLGALMCSGLGVAMVVAVAVAAVLRRRWQIAVLHTAPLVGAYLVWFAIIGHESASQRLRGLSASRMISFATNGIEAAFSGLGHVPELGLVYGLMLAVGVVLLVSQSRRAVLPVGAASALGLLAGALAFVITTALSRSARITGFAPGLLGFTNPRAGRYVYVLAALMLPAIALAAQVIIRAWRPAAALVGVLLLVSFGGNVKKFSDLASDTRPQALRRYLVTVPRLPAVHQVRRSLVVAPLVAPITIGWLVDNLRAGRLPSPGRLSETDIANATLVLTLRSWRVATPTRCQTLSRQLVMTIPPNGGLRIKTGTATVAYAPLLGPRSLVVTLGRGGSVYDVFKRPLRMLVAPVNRSAPVVVCTPVPEAVRPSR